jgi:hypothetical protein
MYKCPHCGEYGISMMRKMFLGPAYPATCKVCKKKVGVPYTAMLAGIPFVIAIIIATLVDPIAVKVLLWNGGFILTAIIHMLWVPLEPR